MPVTELQADVAKLLAVNRTPDSYLAGGTALHFEPNTERYSNDLDYFHDSAERVATAFEEDRQTLAAAGFDVNVDMHQPGYVRAVVRRGGEATKIEWAHDSDWRFLPTIPDEAVGFRLHPLDLAINKVLALAGRDEARDYLDVHRIMGELLPLGPLCWAAAGKDPGFTPLSLLEILRRRGKHRPEDFARLHLVAPVDLPALKQAWLGALEDAERFVHSRPAEEVGCLYYSPATQEFVQPELNDTQVVLHFGRPGGILPAVARG